MEFVVGQHTSRLYPLDYDFFSFTVVITSIPNKLVIAQGEIVCSLNSLTSTTGLQYVQSK